MAFGQRSVLAPDGQGQEGRREKGLKRTAEMWMWGRWRMSQRKDGKPNWDEVLMQEISQALQIGRVVPGATLSDETQGKSGSRNRGQGRVAKSWGRIETVGSRNYRIGKNGQKATVLRWFTTKDLPVFMSAGRSLHQDMKRSWCCLDLPSSCSAPLLPSQPPWPLSLLQLPHWLLVSSSRSSQSNKRSPGGKGLAMDEAAGPHRGLSPLQICARFSSPDTAPHPQGCNSPPLMGELWAPPRLGVETSAQATKPWCNFWARSGEMEEIQGVRQGRAAERGAWRLGTGAWLWDLGAVQGVKSKSIRVLSHCCRRGAENGNFPERQKGLWKWVRARWEVKQSWAPPEPCHWIFHLVWGQVVASLQPGLGWGIPWGQRPPSVVAGAQAVISSVAFALHYI